MPILMRRPAKAKAEGGLGNLTNMYMKMMLQQQLGQQGGLTIVIDPNTGEVISTSPAPGKGVKRITAPEPPTGTEQLGEDIVGALTKDKIQAPSIIPEGVITGRVKGMEPTEGRIAPEGVAGEELGAGRFLGGREFEAETIKAGGVTLKPVPTIEEKAEVLETERAKKRIGTEEAAIGEVLKLSTKAKANFGRATGMFSTVIAQAKGMQEEQKAALEKLGIETTGLGLVAGAAGEFGVKTKRPWAQRTAAFRGQIKETAIGLNSILTGQNRVIRSVIKMIQETLPEPTDPEGVMATKLAQSITNAYRLVKSFEKAGYTPDKLEGMEQSELDKINARRMIASYQISTEERQELEDIIDDVLATPAMPARAFGEREELPEGVSEEDIQETMRIHSLTREEVLQRIQ